MTFKKGRLKSVGLLDEQGAKKAKDGAPRNMEKKKAEKRRTENKNERVTEKSEERKRETGEKRKSRKSGKEERERNGKV